MDWEHEVIDVFLVVNDQHFDLKGFDDIEWEAAHKFAHDISEALDIPNLGDMTDT